MKQRSGWRRAFAVFMVLLAISIAATLVLAVLALPLDHTTISIDGENLQIQSLDGWHAVAAFALAVVGILIALVVTVLAVVFALAMAAIGLLIALAAVALSLLVAASPILVLVWVVWAIARPSRAGVPAATA